MMIVVKIHEDEGMRTGIQVKEGSKWIYFIWPDCKGMKIQKLRKAGIRIIEMPEYPLSKAKRALRRCGRNFGITTSARRVLRG